ncbi:hypothetical protein BU15DRAFT_79424 [Melanogaster broomeanus]|nr:hypothetical protein BU15DRAFT_79424 [Melanogaster broomeanus]
MGLLSWLGLKKLVSGTSHGSSSRTSLPVALFPLGEYTTPVGIWASSIQALPDSDDCRLRRIVHCKATSGSRHEFLLVYIRHSSGKEAIVLADRESASESQTPSVLSNDTMHPQWAISAPRCRDRVKLSHDGTAQCLTRHIPSWAEVHVLKFKKLSEAPSVAHLAALLTILDRHMLSPLSSPEQQSSWFVYCVVEVLKEIFGGDAKTSKKWARAPYGGMRVDNRDTVDALIREFTSSWEDFSRRRVQNGGGRPGDKAQAQAKHKAKKAKNERMNYLADMLRTVQI